MLANMALAKGHSSKTKSQVSDIRTIGPLFFLSFLTDLLPYMFFMFQCFTETNACPGISAGVLCRLYSIRLSL